MARKAEEIQGFAERNEGKNFFDDTKAVYGPPTKGPSALLSADGTILLTEKTQILNRWVEHFRSILYQPFTISNAVIDRLPAVEANADLNLLPSYLETIRAVQKLSNWKEPISCAIPAEIYKHDGPQLMNQLTVIFQAMWCQGQVSQDFKDATFFRLYKKRRNRQLFDNRQGILLLNIATKIFACILPNHLNGLLVAGCNIWKAFGSSICFVPVVNAPVTASSWYPTLTCGSSKLGSSQRPTPGNHHDRRAKPGEGLRCMCLHIRNRITQKLEDLHAPDDNPTVET
ncbi:unnamed protein product [Schistocephalus solidus]|uniref:Uncharacterized protein n=1 Tax=Schistocephalus solidus TaxID=70667 RepID=A0A183SDY8_SCHSO|nr:unnamed protein product [Schistocephalus solidus]